MDVSAIQNSQSQSATATTGTGSASLGQADFLKLLVSQLQNQDPTNPLDDKAFVTQLAQFSSLEQAIEANSNLKLLQSSQNAIANTQVANLVGKTVTVKSNTVDVAGSGDVAPLNLSLTGAASQVGIQIVDSNGKVVRTINAGALGAGQQAVAWNGLADDGTRLAAGQYRVQVDAKDSAGGSVAVSNEIDGVVSGVDFESGSPQLLVGTLRVAPADIIQIRGS